MTASWLDFCIRLDGPRDKTGYGGVTGRRADEVEGEVDHSTEGPLAAALGELQKLERQASWHFTVPKSGPPLQHYPIFGEYSICWHCGLPGDRRTDTSLIGNLTLIGIEHVDWPDNVLNDNQLHWSVELTKAFRRLCPRIAAQPPTLRVNLFEHNWLSATSCPSGLIPWAKKLAALQSAQEEPMTPQERAEFDALKALVEEHLKGATEATIQTNPHLSLRQIEDHIIIRRPDLHIEISPEFIDQLTALLPSAGGYTDAQAVKAVKDAL